MDESWGKVEEMDNLTTLCTREGVENYFKARRNVDGSFCHQETLAKEVKLTDTHT